MHVASCKCHSYISVDIAYEGSKASRIFKYTFKPSRSHLLSNIRYARAPTAARQNRMLDMNIITLIL
jgi:hypothetical protein